MPLELSDACSYALQTACIVGPQVQITCGQMEKDDFEQFKKVMKLCRGAWKGGKAQAFVFPEEIDPGPLIKDIWQSGHEPEANRYSLYPTPEPVVDIVFELIGDKLDYLSRPLKILEPQAGLGVFVLRAKQRFPEAEITAIDIDPVNVAMMQSRGIDAICADFLEWETEEEFDLILSNPPFDGTACAHHFNKMWGLINPATGILACILPDKIRDRTNVLPVQRMLDTITTYGYWEELPKRSFAPQTNVATFIAVLDKGSQNERIVSLYISMDTDHQTCQQIDEIFKDPESVPTDLFGHILDPDVQTEFREVVICYMTREKCYRMFSEDEWKEVEKYSLDRYLEERNRQHGR